MNLKCVVVDDEPLAINVIKSYIDETPGLELLNSFNNAVKSIEFIRSNDVDLLFLDINMPLLDGLNLLKSLTKKPLAIITTAHHEYAVESYELEVLDYLVKPIPFYRFVMAVNKGYENNDTSIHTERAFIFVNINKKKMQKIFLDEILTIESLKDYIKINTISNKYIVHQTLGSFTDSLPSDKFIRIHRSYTISIDKVEAIEGNSVEISGIRYTIGRSYLSDTKSILLDNKNIS